MSSKIMISSTAHDLPQHRRAVREACRSLKHTEVMMEDLAALDADTIEASLAMVDEADVYVGIFAFRYGHIPATHNPDGISITEMEYRRAVDKRKPRLIFVAAEDHVPGLEREADREAAYKLTEFKKRVMGDRVVKFFTSPDHLRALVTEALVAWEQQGTQWMPEPLPDPDYLPQDGVLPPGSRVVVGRAEYFVGREDVLVDLAKSLLHAASSDDDASSGDDGAKIVIKPAVATGAGGIGKTVLAVEFAHRYGRYFYGVHWINLFGIAGDDIDAHLRAEIAANGQRMNLPGFPDDLPTQVQMTLEAWRNTPPRLLILDNAESPQAVKHALRMVPGMRVLVTSRWGEDGDWRVIGVTPRPLDTLTRTQSLKLLRDLAPHLHRLPDADLNRLASRLGDYPLALHLAGRYLDRMRRVGGISIDDYLRRLDTEGMAHPAFSQADHIRDPALAQHHGTIAHCLGLSWEHVDDPVAERLFRACGYLAPNTPIPPQVLLIVAGNNREALALALTQLVQYGLLAPHTEVDEAGSGASSADGEQLAIHPLLADFARSLDMALPAQERVLPKIADTMARASKAANDTGLPDSFTPIRPHIETVAEFADAAGIQEAGPLWTNLGAHHRMLADYATTRQHFERALAIGRRLYGDDHPAVAIRLNNLGALAFDLGDLHAARDHIARALAINERAFGPNHTSVAGDLNNLGNVIHDMGDLDTARAHYERALAIWEGEYGPEHPQVAIALSNLGVVLKDLGDFETASQHYQRALAIDERHYGPHHPTVGIRLNNLGSVLYELGDLAGARQQIERVVAIDEQVFGPHHPEVAIDLSNLGNVLAHMGETALARQCFERSLRIFEAKLPPSHPKTETVRRLLHLLNTTPYIAPTLNHMRYFLRNLPGERARRSHHT